jgi:hypothetical protein
MPVRMINFVKEPPPRNFRGGRTPIYQTEEWQDVTLALGSGLKPQEYISVSFPDTHQIHQQLKNPLTSMIHLLKKKVKELGLPYDVYERNQVVYVVGRGVIS